MANIITLSRFPLLFIYLGLMYTGSSTVIFWCVPFLVLIILMDMVDGMVARRLGEVSLLGSTLDIAVDRAFEVILWVVYAHLGLIPVIIPIIVITRGTLTDAVRCVGIGTGTAAFDQIKRPLGRFLVSSRFMRDLYGIAKGFAFAFITIDWGVQALCHAWSDRIHFVALVLSWSTVTLTIIRGIPVLIEEAALLKTVPLAKE